MVVWIKLLAVNWWEVLKFWVCFIRNVVHGGLGGDWRISGVPVWEFAGTPSQSVWASTCSVTRVGPSRPRWRRLPEGKFSQLANVCRQVIVSRECRRFQCCSDPPADWVRQQAASLGRWQEVSPQGNPEVTLGTAAPALCQRRCLIRKNRQEIWPEEWDSHHLSQSNN